MSQPTAGNINAEQTPNEPHMAMRDWVRRFLNI